jgi:acetyltransferase-like isoleucine patch superfamily enzyme
MIIRRGVVIEGGRIGHGCHVGYNTVIRDNAVIGNHVYISHLCVIADGTMIENDVFIGPGVVFTNTKHICHGRDRGHTGHKNPIVVKRGARIGAGVTILPGVVIGEESEIGAGSVVTKSTLPYRRYWGVPAEMKGWVPEEEMLIKNDTKEQTNGA